jgi:hypothetical protein
VARDIETGGITRFLDDGPNPENQSRRASYSVSVMG